MWMSCGWNVSTSGMFVCSWGGKLNFFMALSHRLAPEEQHFTDERWTKLCVCVFGRISYTPRRTFTHRGAGEFMEDFCGSVNATRVFFYVLARDF